jgi:hypothetical protein
MFNCTTVLLPYHTVHVTTDAFIISPCDELTRLAIIFKFCRRQDVSLSAGNRLQSLGDEFP